MKQPEQLIGLRVTVRPNDFITRPLAARVQAVDRDTKALLLEFDVPFEINQARYSRAVAGTRLKRDLLDTLLSTGVLGFAVTWVPDNRFVERTPFDLSWWRGGGAAIADVMLDRDGGDGERPRTSRG